MDLAASVQVVSEEIIMKAARHLHRETGLDRLCLAGGVALNCVANGKLLADGPFKELWIQPAAGDSGGAVGAALHVWHQLLDRPRQGDGCDAMSGGWLGPSFTDDEIRTYLRSAGAVFHSFDTDAALCDRVADLISQELVVGWFQDRMEFGPRALGARSIIGDARSPKLQSTMNVKIKFRESFRPFAPVVLKERAHEFFDIAPGTDSPYMLLVAPVKADHRTTPHASGATGLDRVKEVRSDIPAVTHVDYSARIQTVDAVRHKRFHTLLKTFERKTGCPVLINTSFNVRGEPIVCSPQDAYRCFMGTDMDVLVLERSILLKQDQPASAAIDRERYVGAFHPD
jgi:carbamoyltransferase